MIDFLLGTGVGFIFMGLLSSSVRARAVKELELQVEQQYKKYCDLYLKYTDEIERSEKKDKEIHEIIKRVKGAN